MPVSDAQKKASVRYLEKLDEVRIRMPKGKKAIIQFHAEAQGQSVNAYINTAIDEKMAQEAAEAAGEAVPQFIARAVETQAQRDEAGRKVKGGQ